MVAFLPAKRTILSIQEDTLADMGFHVALGRLCGFAGPVAKRTIRICDFYCALARTDWALLNVSLSHPL
jgi:hypothetical protein